MTWYIRVGKDTYEGLPAHEPARSEALAHIAALHVPPAYVDVHINHNPNAKIQAYGFDAKGRKQTLYHPNYVKQRAAAKFRRVRQIMDKYMPIIQKDIARDATKDIARQHVAIALLLMLHCGFRVGSEKYRRAYGTYGITTLERRHFKRIRGGFEISFVGKKGVVNEAMCTDPIIKRFLAKRLKALERPSDPVFECTAKDVNAYLQEYHPSITAKDVRTWNANQLFREWMQRPEVRAAPNPVKEAIRKVSHHLHHTAHVCQKSYVDPAIAANALKGNGAKKRHD
jgi:DNA topoisomerase I